MSEKRHGQTGWLEIAQSLDFFCARPGARCAAKQACFARAPESLDTSHNMATNGVVVGEAVEVAEEAGFSNLVHLKHRVPTEG